MLGRLLFQKVLIGNRDGHLRLDLEQLVLHVDDKLLQHLFRVLRFINQIVEVGPEKSGDSFHECHDQFLSALLAVSLRSRSGHRRWRVP
jgi:hypothetical protein